MRELKLLVVEDDELMAQMISSIARRAGFTVMLPDGAFTEGLCEHYNPDVIILDILMPTVDGFEVIQYLKKCSSRARIILLSGDENYRRMAKNIAGKHVMIEDSIAKPFDIDDLHTRLVSLQQTLQKPGAESAA